MKIDIKDISIILIVTLVIFSGTYAVLNIFGYVPEEFSVSDSDQNESNSVSKYEFNGQNEFENSESNNNNDQSLLLPDKITIDKIGVDSVIQKPQSQEISVLDRALNKGAVYYPGSGTINRGNMFIFGHSTGFSVVNNQAYKTFNDLNELSKGDEIKVQSNGKTYVYKVDTLTLVDESEAYVDFSKTERMLTISTCNSFGTKQERWVVEAVFDREV